MLIPNELNPYLYILMRNDLDSLNSGKMVAQGAHAANQFTHEMKPLLDRIARRDEAHEAGEAVEDIPRPQWRLWRLYDQWIGSTPDGFGVTICLGVSGAQLASVVTHVKEHSHAASVCAGITHDPSYPLQDGPTLHLLPLDTCGYVFGEKDELRVVLGQFNLLP